LFSDLLKKSGMVTRLLSWPDAEQAGHLPDREEVSSKPWYRRYASTSNAKLTGIRQGLRARRK